MLRYCRADTDDAALAKAREIVAEDSRLTGFELWAGRNVVREAREPSKRK